MITRLVVDNFKALRHVEVGLQPVTVLIGPNDSGKSSFLEAVYALGESTRANLVNCFFSSWQERELVHQQSKEAFVRCRAHLTTPALSGTNRPTAEVSVAYELALTFRPDHQIVVEEEKIGRSDEEHSTSLPQNGQEQSTTLYRYN